MADKKFSVITGGQPAVKPRHGGQLWRQVINEYEIDDAAGLEMLALACQQLDRAEECREQIDRDGLMIRTKTGPKDHPLLRSELSARGFVCRTLHSGPQRRGDQAGRSSTGHGWLPDNVE